MSSQQVVKNFPVMTASSLTWNAEKELQLVEDMQPDRNPKNLRKILNLVSFCHKFKLLNFQPMFLHERMLVHSSYNRQKKMN